MPVIHTYHSASAPTHEQWLAFFFENATKDGKASLSRLPMVFAASTEEGARATAEKWWADERAKEENRRALADRLRASRTKAEAA